MQNDSQFSLELSRVDATHNHSFEPVFRVASHEELLDQLAHGAQFNPGIQVVEGPVGSGKSTLAASLYREHLATCEHRGAIQVEPGEAPQVTLAKVAMSLGVGAGHAQSAGELMAALRHFSQSLHAQSQVGILVIDDAQQLDQQTIAALLSLLQGTAESGFGLHFVLWSEPGLIQRLDALQLVDVAVHDFVVPLLSLDEVQAVVRQLPAGPQWDVRQLWAESEGRIGQLKSLIQEQLTNDRPADQIDIPTAHQADPPVHSLAAGTVLGLPVLHVAALALLVVVLIGALFAWDPTSGTLDSAPGSGGAELEASGIATMGRGNAPAQTSSDAASGSTRSPEANAPVASEITVPNNDLRPSEPSSEEGEAAIGDFSLEPVIADRELRQALYGRASTTISSDPVATKEPVESERAHSNVAPAPALEPDSGLNPAPKSPHQPKVAETPEPVMEAPLSPDVEKLLGFAPDSYSLQIMAATSRQSLERFKAAQLNAGELYLYQTERQGKPWFLLLSGNFPSRAAASDAIERLPSVQKSAGPWPRRLENVQQEIESVRGR